MQRMPNINIDQRTLNWLFMNQLYSGGEAVICRSYKKNTLFKIFADWECQKQSDSFGVPFHKELIKMSDNKFKKITRLYQMQLEHSVNPLSTLSMDGNLIGYEMTYDPNDKSFDSEKLSREELIYFLSQSKDILEYYAQNDITYGDVTVCNLLVNRNSGTTKFCDMDNIRLGEYPIESMGRDLFIYKTIRGIDQYTDAYMHNVMTLRNFSPASLNDVLEPVYRLVHEDYSKDLTSTAKTTLMSMEEPQTFNGEYVIKYIKK